jgi:hypothetical protein
MMGLGPVKDTTCLIKDQRRVTVLQMCWHAANTLGTEGVVYFAPLHIAD